MKKVDFVVCEECGKHAQFFFEGDPITLPVFSKQMALAYVGHLPKGLADESECLYLVKKIMECDLPFFINKNDDRLQKFIGQLIGHDIPKMNVCMN